MHGPGSVGGSSMSLWNDPKYSACLQPRYDCYLQQIIINNLYAFSTLDTIQAYV